MKFFKDWAYWREQVMVAKKAEEESNFAAIVSKNREDIARGSFNQLLGNLGSIYDNWPKVDPWEVAETYLPTKLKEDHWWRSSFWHLSNNKEMSSEYKSLFKFLDKIEDFQNERLRNDELSERRNKFDDEVREEASRQTESLQWSLDLARKESKEIPQLKEKIESQTQELTDLKLLIRQVAQDPATDRLIKKLKRTVTP